MTSTWTASLTKLVPSLRSEVERAEKELESLQNQEAAVEDSIDRNRMVWQKSTEFLKTKAHPDENTAPANCDDDELEYFLALGEMQNIVKELRMLKENTEKNLDSLQTEYTLSQQLLEERRVLNDQIQAELRQRRKGEKEKQPSVLDKIQEAEQKIRRTRVAYKDLKQFIGSFLERIDPEKEEGEGSQLGMLLQDLWRAFFNKDNESSYLRISELDFTCDENEITKITEAGIVEFHSEDKDQIRMVDFTMG